MPRRGQLEPAAQADLAVERFAYDYQIGAFKRFAVFNFHFVTRLAYPLGAAPPGPKGQRGHEWLFGGAVAAPVFYACYA